MKKLFWTALISLLLLSCLFLASCETETEKSECGETSAVTSASTTSESVTEGSTEKETASVEDGYLKLGFVDIPIVESEAQFDEIWAEKMSYEEGRIVSIKVKVNILLDDKSEGFDEAMAAIEAATLLYVSDRYAPLITCYLPSPYKTEQLKALAKLDAITSIRLDVRVDYYVGNETE